MELIIATDLNYMIGRDNKIPWDCKEDLNNFKEITSNNNIIMGKTTFCSLPVVLTTRNYFVLTRNKNWKEDFDFVDKINKTKQKTNIFIKNSIDFFKPNFHLNEYVIDKDNPNKLDIIETSKIRKAKNFIIGGKEIYKQFLDSDAVTKIHLSTIKIEAEKNDTSVYFLELKDYLDKFVLHNKEDKGDYIYSVYHRK